MSSSDAHKDQLHAVQRLQEIELEYARVERARLEKAADEERQRISDLETRLDANRALEVRLMTDGVPVETLRQVRGFLQAQAREMLQQEQILRKAEAAADDALLSMLRHFEKLSATRRLRERRAAETSAQQLRARFKEFDDMAMITKRTAE